MANDMVHVSKIEKLVSETIINEMTRYKKNETNSFVNAIGPEFSELGLKLDQLTDQVAQMADALNQVKKTTQKKSIQKSDTNEDSVSKKESAKVPNINILFTQRYLDANFRDKYTPETLPASLLTQYNNLTKEYTSLVDNPDADASTKLDKKFTDLARKVYKELNTNAVHKSLFAQFKAEHQSAKSNLEEQTKKTNRPNQLELEGPNGETIGVEEIAEEVAEEVAEEIAEEMADEVAEEAVEEMAEEAVEEEAVEEETVDEVAEEIAEEVVEEVAEELAEEIIEEVVEETVATTPVKSTIKNAVKPKAPVKAPVKAPAKTPAAKAAAKSTVKEPVKMAVGAKAPVKNTAKTPTKTPVKVPPVRAKAAK